MRSLTKLYKAIKYGAILIFLMIFTGCCKNKPYNIPYAYLEECEEPIISGNKNKDLARYTIDLKQTVKCYKLKQEKLKENL